MIKSLKKVFEYELLIKLVAQEDGSFVAISPAWKDCYAQGDTIDEAILEITAVAQTLIELYKEEGMEIPLKLQSQKKTDSSSFSVPIFVTS